MKSLQELLQPQTDEPDASIVEVFGSKSKDADDIMDYVYNLHGTIGPTPFHETAEGQDYMLSVAEGLAFPGAAIGSIGKKVLKGVAGKMPKMAETMPRTQTYQFSDVKPHHRTRPNTQRQKLLDKLESDELDAFEELEVRRELDNMQPEWDEFEGLQDQPFTMGTPSPAIIAETERKRRILEGAPKVMGNKYGY